MATFREVLVRTLRRGSRLAGGAVILAWLLLPWPLVYLWRDPGVTSLMQYRVREAGEGGESFVVRHEWVPLQDISPAVVRAVVAAEDGRFRGHRGVDWQALGEEVGYEGDGSFSWLDPRDLGALRDAVAYAWSHRDELRGRSTITQQLAKNLYFTPERSLGRKAAELVVAWRLEWLLSKDRILELYLNSVELGPGLFGVEAAARAYFGRPASALGVWEAASLAATLPHPLTSNPAYRPARMAWRRDLILQRLRGPAGGDRSPIPTAPGEPAEPPPPPPPDTGGVPPDAGPPDTVPPDTVPPDTVPPDGTPPETSAPDTSGPSAATIPGPDTTGGPRDRWPTRRLPWRVRPRGT